MLFRSGISQDVLGEFFEFGPVFRRDGVAGVEVEAGVLPGVEHLNTFGWEEFPGDEELQAVGAEEFFERFEREFG